MEGTGGGSSEESVGDYGVDHGELVTRGPLRGKGKIHQSKACTMLGTRGPVRGKGKFHQSKACTMEVKVVLETGNGWRRKSEARAWRDRCNGQGCNMAGVCR